MTEPRYKISEFSRITRLTPKALRYYDEEGLLRPSLRGENDYRLYTEKDYEKAKLLYLLRGLSFSVAEMKDVAAAFDEGEDLRAFFAEKQGLLQRDIQRKKQLVRDIEKHLFAMKAKEAKQMEYQITMRQLPAVEVVSTRYQGAYGDTGKYIGALYRKAGSKAAGAPFNLYYDEEYQEVADIELCLPLKGPVPGSKTLPAVQGIALTHKGPYEELHFAYKALTDYAQQHHLSLATPNREIYIKGPGMVLRGDPANYVTEIVFPFREEV